MESNTTWVGKVDSDFLTAEEISTYLRLPLSTVYKLAQDKRLPGFKVGKHWRFRNEAIQNWIKDQEQKDDSKIITENI